MTRTRKQYNLLQKWCFRGADDADGTMLMTDLVVAGESLELNFGITIYVERNKRSKPVNIWLCNNEDKRKNFLLRSFSITSIYKTLSGPNQIVGNIVAFCEVMGIARKELKMFFLDKEGNRHEQFIAS